MAVKNFIAPKLNIPARPRNRTGVSSFIDFPQRPPPPQQPPPISPDVLERLLGARVGRGEPFAPSDTVTPERGFVRPPDIRSPEGVPAELVPQDWRKLLREGEYGQWMDGGGRFRIGTEAEKAKEREPSLYKKIEKPVVASANIPVANIGGVVLTTGDLAGLGLLAYGGYQVARALPQLFKTVGDKALQTALNTGLDKWIAQRSRGVPAQRFKTVQDVLYNAIVKNKTWLQQRATENMLNRMGRGAKQSQAATQAVEETIKNFENELLPTLTVTNTAVPGQTLTMSEILAGIRGVTPQTVQAVQGVRAELTKQPWQMTNNEYQASIIRRTRPNVSEEEMKRIVSSIPDRLTGTEHKGIVQEALSEGKPVPPEVLKDYPDLVSPVSEAPVTRIPEGVRPPVHIEDLEGMDTGAKILKTVKDNTGANIVIKQDGDSFYAVKDGQVIGFVSPLSNTELDLNVVVEEQKKGIGTKLLVEFRKQFPEHPTGGLTVAGERTELAAQRELAQPTPTPTEAGVTPAEGVKAPISVQTGLQGLGKEAAQAPEPPAAASPINYDIISGIKTAKQGTIVGTLGDYLQSQKLRDLYAGALDTPIMVLNKPVQGGQAKELPRDYEFYGGFGNYQGKPAIFVSGKHTGNQIRRTLFEEGAHILRKVKGREITQVSAEGFDWAAYEALPQEQQAKKMADYAEGLVKAPQPAPPTQPTAVTPPAGTVQPIPPTEQPTPPETALSASQGGQKPQTPVEATQKVNEIQEKAKTAPKRVKAADARYAHVEKAAPDGPQPPAKPPAKVTSKSRNPDDYLKGLLDAQLKGERLDETVVRLYGAAARNVRRRTSIQVEKISNELKQLGIGAVKRGQVVPREEDKPILDALYIALHNPGKVETGEVQIPKGFENVYKELRELADWDTASRLDFDPAAATIEDWFFRGWKPPEGMFGEAQKGTLGTKPKALRMPRVNATYQELRGLGFEPLFWNPAQQWGYRHNLGEIYREQMTLIEHLKSLDNDIIRPDAGGPLPEGWKIPKIGPAFEGKPFAVVDADGIPGVMFTRRWAVTARTSNLLEQMFGKRPDIGKFVVAGKEIDPLAIIDWVAFVPKRAKLFLSLFQHIDFLTRAGSSSWGHAVDAILAGKPFEAAIAPLRFPASVMEIIEANLSPGKRLSLSEQMDDTTPLVRGRPGVHLQGISGAGLSVMDVTIWAGEMDKLMSLVAKQKGILGNLTSIGSSIVDLESAMRRGLFNGVYPAAMITDIKKNIALMMVRAHPTATDAQINGYIAKEANIKYSTIPPEQSKIQNIFFREVLRRVAFSFSESEALLRQTTRMFHGPNKRYWMKQNLGVYLFVLLVANLIHLASTGEPLPKDRYVPIAKDNWGPLPFGYNTKFASPTLPFKGRGGSEVTMDLMGQMDTAFRVLNPAFFISARASVPVRATINQVSGTDFYGAPIDDVGPGGIYSRATQLGLDLFSPIGVGGIATELARGEIPGAEEVIPEGESRLGYTGLGIQATGVNLRAEGTTELLDRFAQKQGANSWSELEPYQKDLLSQDKELVAELKARQETSVERQVPGARGYATRANLEEKRIDRGESLVNELETGQFDPNTFRDEVTKLKVEIAARKSQVDEDFQLYQDTQEMPEDPNKKALVEYYTIYDKAQRESKSIDWDLVDRWETIYRQKWTPEQEAYVDRNIGLTEWGPKMREYIDAQKVLNESGFWDIEEPDQYDKRMRLRESNPKIEAILQKWYGYKPMQPTSTKKFQPIETTPRWSGGSFRKFVPILK